MLVSSFFDFWVVGTLVVLFSFVCVVFQRKHLLMVLLCLEAVMLGLIYCFFFGLFFFSSGGFLVLVMLSLVACEASVGLGLLVSLIRSHGSDFVSVLSLFSC